MIFFPETLLTKSAKSHQRRKAFTLIELLVVIAIIAILAAILFPVFAQAKESAKRTNCISNVKNIATAAMLYIHDFDDEIPTTYHYDTLGPTSAQTWFSGRIGYTTSAVKKYGILDPYMKSEPLKSCPSAKDLPPGPTNAYHAGVLNQTGYSPNGFFVTPNNMSDVQLPAETLMLADAGAIDGINYAGHTRTWKPIQCGDSPTSGGITVSHNRCLIHARHNKTATIAWLDGHVKNHKITHHRVNTGMYTEALMTQSNLGNVLKYPPQYPTTLNWGTDVHYYAIDKDLYL